ncbi:protein RRNAD1 isoform X1 [Heterodontus francisci]|uniref:protein RRNAD1 isoform X1 n=1 Tax=Heterodontus francisci TaxID=7792 RepID=UPI00355C500B
MPLAECHQRTFEQQKQRAADIVRLLSTYSHVLDSYVIEFFSENLWEKVPRSWHMTLSNLTTSQLSTLLLEQGPCVRHESVWPLSLLAYRAAAHALAFSRQPRGGPSPLPAAAPGAECGPEEFRANRSQSSRLSHHFRRHVKPKKQHEIRRLGALVKKLCDATGCERVVDVGSGQGHLSRYLAFGHGLRLTGVEAGKELVATAIEFDRQLLLSLRKEAARKPKSDDSQETPSTGDPCIRLPRHLVGWVDTTAPWEDFLQLLESEGSPEQGGEGSGWWRRGDPFVLTGLHACGDLGPAALRHFAHCPSILGITAVSCCYMKATTAADPAAPPPAGASESGHGYPMSSWVRGLPGHGLPYKLRELACHAIEDYAERLKGEGAGLRVHCYRAVLETIIRQLDSSLRRPGVQTTKKAHLLPFEDYARAGLQKLGLDSGAQWDTSVVQSMLAQEGKVVAYYCLNLLLAPVIESLILLDRVIYLKEQGFQCELLPLFDPAFSPRNFVLVAAKVAGQLSDFLGPEEGSGCADRGAARP